MDGNMMPFAEQAAKHGFVPIDHYKPNYFKVLEGDVFAPSGKKITGYKLLEREDTGDTLAIHSKSYRVVSDQVVFGAFERALNISGLDIGGMMVAMDRSHDGARMFVQYTLPNITREIRGSPVSLRFLMWNAYDGSRAASGRAGFYEWVCANQSVVGDTLNVFKIRHAGNQDAITEVEAKIDALVNGAKTAQERLELMTRWPNVPVVNASAHEVFKSIPGSTDRLLADLNLAWTEASDADGHNLWTLNTVLTAWATHTSAKSNKATVAVERQERIARTIAAKPFQQLAALA